jgi:hypothetical protein
MTSTQTTNNEMTDAEYFPRYNRIGALYNAYAVCDEQFESLIELLDTADVNPTNRAEQLRIVDGLLDMYEAA